MKKVVRLTESDLVRLVKKVLNEQSGMGFNVPSLGNQIDPNKLGEINSQLNGIGLRTQLSSEDVMELPSVMDCPIEEPSFSNPQDSKIFQQLEPKIEMVKQNVKGMKLGEVLSNLKLLNSKMKNKPNKMSEQAGAAIMIAGVAIPSGAILVVGGILVLILLSKLVGLMLGGGTKQNKDCERKQRLYNKFGPSGVV
jgi:hypothetical protein